MKTKIKISAISYINTLPFSYGIETCRLLKDRIILSKDIPSICSKKLINNEVDLGLIPVAEISKIKSPKIISNYCIGAVGKVNTVFLFSDVPLNEIKQIYLDYQSRTSVKLLKILAKNYWKINPVFINTAGAYEDMISGTNAGLIIGDRAFKYIKKFEHIYDLSEEWMNFTSLPFVFAAWVANKELPQSFINDFNDALKNGLESKDYIIKSYLKDNVKINFDIEKYLKQDISYHLDAEKRKGMDLFLKMLNLHYAS